MNKENIKEKIEELLQKTGIPQDENRAIFKIEPSENENEKRLILEDGKWSQKNPWFGINEEGDSVAMVPIDMFITLLEILKKTQQENFNLKLEKSIWQQIPVDFQDVWTVAIEEVKKLAQEGKIDAQNIDLNEIVKNIKKRHPNLFLDMGGFLSNNLLR